MTNGTDNEPDPTRPDVGWDDPQPADQQHPDSAFPGAGERVSDDKAAEALEAFPDGSATVGDMVDAGPVDSTAHEAGPGAQEVADQVDGAAVD
jgi:hypothetical protein